MDDQQHEIRKDEDDDARTDGGGSSSDGASSTGASGDVGRDTGAARDGAGDTNVSYAGDGNVPYAIERTPSSARGIGMLDLLSAGEWLALAQAARIPAEDMERAFVGGATPAVTALMAWIVPAIWTILAARHAVETRAGLTLHLTPGVVSVNADHETYDTVLAEVMIEGPKAFGHLCATVPV